MAALAGLPESPQLARALARLSQLEMLKQRPEAIERAREALGVALRVGDSFAELNARINIFTREAAQGIAPDPDELAAIVEAATEVGEYEEGYRAIVNFIWSASGNMPIDRIELVVSEARGRLGDVPPPKSIGPYLEVSTAMALLVPSGRWSEADAVLAEFGESDLGATTRLIFLVVAGGLAFRRGDAQAAQQLLEELPALALASGEPQRMIPMAGVVLPWLAVSDNLEELRSLINEILAVVDRQWLVVLDAVPVVRALASAGETQLLERTVESMRATPDVSAKLQTAVTVGQGLLALAHGRAVEAAEQLDQAIERERKLGRTYDAACLELDLARALEAAGEAAGAEETRARAAAVLEPLGCVNPF
jgi:hypothetical protein